MGDQPGGHEVGERLYVPGDSVLHRMPAHLKIISMLTTLLVVVATPGRFYWAFTGYALLVAALVAVARIPVPTLLSRMAVEIPFVVFALLMPFFGSGPRIDVGPLSLSEAGLLAAWTLLAKATIGVALSVVLGATTTTSQMVEGLRRMHLPDLLVQIFASMVRYVHVVSAEAARMSRARQARGFTATGPRAWPVLGRSLGTLFIRSYERGERVHLAMLSRGYTGTMPVLHPPQAASRATAAAAAAPPLFAAAVLAAATAVAGVFA